ncbi:LPD38 domain-containing protein [Marseilla massiliensis]|uniref:LPD38 domain-containing protein n=1 Tax=Marseilla massiliensis TaxID=1841864 RepID=UPI002010D125|nr:LPD38 domain-containing protein [Marseilla massiliensis]MCL1609479.1 strawberry notch C-terminal domain-containing protein [Marseilla massiliensis]
MPNKITYTITTSDGKSHQVSEDNIKKYGMQSYANAYKGATIRMRDKDGADYDIPLGNYNDAQQQGLHPFRYEHTPAKETAQQKPQETSRPAKETDEPQKPWKPTPMQRMAFNMQAEQFKRDAAQRTRDFNERVDNLQEYGRSFSGGHTASGGLRFNPQSKKMERTYLTPTGERTFNKAAADAVSREYRDAVDMTVGGQIRRAQNRLQELKDKAAARLQELHDKWKQDYENNDAPLAAVLAADTYVPSIQSDQTYRALQAAIRQTEEQIKTLGEQQDRDNGVDVGFWRGFGRVAGDIRTWDFGIGDMMDAMTMMNAAEPKRPQTEQEKAANQEMMRAIHENQQTEAMYGGNASFWNRAGMMTGYMPSFMLDFAMTGGGFDAINVATKTAGKAATKALGKEAVEQMARQGFKTYVKNNGLRGLGQEAANWTIKALGTTADELLIRAPLMTNTVQGMDTAADIIDRKLGDVTIDENGNYNFTNDKTWGSAIWQGEANSIVENYSEMFGAHLPEVASVKNLGRLANVIGAKRLGGVLAKADAGALGGITDGTRRIFQQMGVSDYLGEVSEEYYGQLWRTMLNLDDAYRQNPDGTRTNLFATGQFHGDIWGGMALSMGLMGAGKTAMSAANYLSMKHDVNKADARASELLTPEVWEPLRSTIDMATNDNVGDVAEVIVNDRDMTDEEKAAVMNYMERSLYLRGVNLAELVKSRGGEQDENAQRANDSYMDGYNVQSDVEMQDARSMYELQRQKAEQALTPEELDGIDNDPIGALRNLGDDEAINQTVIDYINAKQVYDGMLQRVRDDIDGRIDQSNTMIDSRTNRKTGMIQGATLKVQDDEGNDRRVYVLDGNLATYEDGTGIDKEKSDGSIIIRDAETGAVEMVSPDAIFSVEQPVDPETEKQTAAEAIRQQFAQEAANRIDGTVAFQPGDTYTVTDESGQAAQIQIVPNADGLVDNGDGTVNVSSDGGQTVVPMRKEDIQAMVDATNRARVAQIEQQREAMQQPQVQEQPTYSLNDEVTLLDENGNEVRGSITADVNEDGQYEVYTENPINGRKVNLFTAEELDRLQANPAENSRQNGGISTKNGGNPAENSRHEDVAIVNQEAVNNATVDDLMKTNRGYVEGYYNEHPEKVAEALAAPAQATADYINGKLTDRDYLIALNYSTGENSWLDGSATEEEIEREAAMNREKYLPYVSMPQVRQEQPAQQPVQSEQPVQSAIERIPKDEKGQPIYEQADPDTAWDAIVEQTEGDEAMAQNVADSMVADKEAELKKVEKSKPKGGTTIAEKIAAERERKNAVEQAKANLALWQKIAQTSQRRRQAALAEQSRQAEEAARLRREQEEKERAEREEAERIRREALNGVPDIIDDTPQDARARGYRRVNGEKIDRQTPLATRQGKEVQVKFDDKNIPTGHVALIEAGQLQPSHINGRRNPFHFIDEAQPKERNDEASVMSARKIAANIRPEEITSSVTAYTGAPTVNTRGEVIQGNNRSAALREMWAGQPEQAAVYKQYLTEHAADFGLAPEDVEAMQQPVLVNMVDVPDDEAISLGQFVAQDTESGGTERIKPKNIVQKMGDDMKGFAGRLLASPDEEMTFSELVDRNGMDVLKWMQAKNYITPTQYRSAFDSKGNLTGEAKNDLKGIMYQSIFQNGNTHLEEMFGALPAKAQKAILATAYRDYDSPNSERMNAELQASINAYYALSQMPDFANAKNYKEARKAAEAWKRQLSFDDVTGESYLPSERYSNFALLLATMYKGQTQVFIQNTLKNIFDLVQGTKEATLFEEPDNTPRTLVEAVNETMNGLSDELLLNENFAYNGQRRNNVLAGGSAAGQQGRQGSTRDDPSGGRTEGGTGIAADNRGTEGGVGQEEVERREADLASRVQVNDDDWQEGDEERPTYKRSIIIDGTHTATQIDEPDENGHYTGSYFEFDNKRFGDIAEIVDYIDNGNTLATKIAQAEAETEQNPTEAQKEAGNYKKGHVRIGQFDITVENPKGSVRRGTDANGKPWETTMQNTYGYIRGTEGVDGDHIDVFLTDDIDGWNGRRVYVVDQYNEDGTFDEHKVMLGFNDEDDARNAYFANYSDDWADKRKIVMTSANLEDFEKWINSSHRKTKPFAEYKSVPAGETKAISPTDRIAEIDEQMADLKKQADEAHKRSDIFEEARLISESNDLYAERRRLVQEMQPSQTEEGSNEQPQEQPGQTDDRYTVEQRYHKKKDTYIYAVKFTEQMPREQFLSLKKRVKDFGGYYSSYGKGGFIFETEEAGRKFAEAVLDPSGEKLDDNKPLSLADMQQSSEPVVHQVDVEGLMQAINENGEAKLSDHFVVGRPGLTEKATSQQTETQTQETEQQPQQSDNNGYGANNKLVSRDRYEELKKRMRQKLGGQLNMGIDPEILAIGTEMAAYHIEAGARKFADYARHMIDDLGDAIRPYLKSFYNGVRDLPEVQEAGYVDEMTPYDEVRTFDVATFDKEQGNAMATAEMVVAEQEAQAGADTAKEQLINQRNKQRRQEDEQRTADTEAVAGQAEAAASKAESDIEAATNEKQVNGTVEEIDRQLDKVNEQLALLGYYEAEPVESDFNEAYGYMRNAEKKAVKDANNLANRLVKDIGIDPKTIVDKKGKRRRSIATANIAPIGGDISIHLPLGDKRELYISIQLDKQDGDNLKVTGGMLRIENPNPERGEERYLSFNNFFAEDETYPSLLRMVQQLVKRYAPDFVPVSNAQQEASTKSGKKPAKRQKKQDESKIADLFSAQEENAVENQENSPFKKGDAVVYKGKPATVYDIEDNGRLVLDTGLAPVLYESADPKEVKPANTATHNAGNTEINRIFANAVKTDMLAALDSGTKPYRSILDLRKRAAALGMEVDNDGRTDILLQELVEDGLVRAAREVVEQHGRDSRESYDLICKLYEMQPTIAARSSNRIKMQQYSTPLPMAWNATRFAMSGKKGGKVLEPTAGNGMLVFAVPANQVHVNELDETRLDNLREQGFAQVTQQDATEPFEGGQQYDVIIANPPFGKSDEVEYDGKMIPGLDPQITLNALASMKDNGKAAIIIGGNMEYGNNGGLKSMKPFFTYLYDHYNVKGVVDMDGMLYSKQGTTFPTRMILIAGRRSDEERAQTAVYPPVESKAIRKADSFDDLYDIIDEVINSKEKTNGTEILRSQQGQLVSVADQPSRNTDGTGHSGQSRKNDDTGHGQRGTAHSTESNSGRSQQVLSREHRTDTGNGETRRGAGGNTEGGSRGVSEPDVQRVGTVGVSTERVGLGETRTEQPKKRTLTEEKSAYRPHNSAFSLQSVAPAAMVEAMDNVLSQIEAENGNIDEFVRKELGYDTTDELHQALAAEQIDSVAMAIYQMKQGQALIIGDQTGVGKGRQMAALIRWAVKRGEKPIFITQKADLFSDIYRDLVDIGSGDLVPFIFNSDGAMVDSNGNTVHKPLSSKEMAKVFAAGQLPDEYDFAVLTYSQVNTGDEVSQKEAEEAAKKRGGRTKKSKASKDGKATPKATFLRAIAEDNYLFLDESHTAAGTSNTGAYLQSILRSAKAATFASATFAKRPDTMPLYAIRTAMSQAKVEPDKLIGIIEKGGVTLQEIMSRELTNAGQMVRRERDMSDVVTDWKTINDPATVKRARENYDRTIAAFNAIIKFQEDYVKPMVDAMDKELAVMAESAGIKRGTDKMGVENVPFASKTYNYTKQLMLALKVDAIANEVDAEIKAGRHPVIALESTMESSIKDYSAGEIISEPTFSASLLRGLDTVMQYTIKDENGKEQHARYTPKQLGEAGEKAYYELQDFIRKSTSDIFISPLDAIIERLHGMGYKVGELTGRNMYVERDDDGRVVVRRRTDKDKKRMQREFNSGELDVLILNKSASTGISLHASEKFSDQRQRTMIIAQPLSDINDYMQMIGRIDRTGQVHRGYYINLGLPVPAENRFLMMLSTKLKSLNANTTTSQDSESNDVEAPDLLNKYGSQVVVEYLRDNPEIYEKMGGPLKKAGQGGGRVQTNELDEYKPQEDDARKITGYVALLTTKEQEEFYDDVVRRYNELIKYLNDTGNNDLKITVMPLRAKTLNKRVSSEGIDPTGTNPFARNSYVEQVEMDVLRKPMKAAEIRKTIEQVNKGKRPEDYIRQVIATIEKEDEVRIAAEEARYERSKAKAQEDIAKQTEKINRQQKRTAEEKQAAIADYVRETNENVETKHNDNMVRLNTNSDMLKQRLHMFEVGKSYLMPDNLESMVFDFSTPAIFCGYKAKDSKITASTTLAVFATLDGRRRMEIKLSQPEALRSIYKTTNDNWDAARSTTLENWDSQIPTGTRKTGFIMTGNILQAIADTQDEHGGYPGQLISYTDIDGNVHDGILMPDKWNTSMLKTSGAPIISRLKQIKNYMPVTSHDGKVDITGSSWAKVYYLTVPKTKKDGAIYYENKALLRAVNGSNFYPYRGKLRADIPEENIEKVVMELSKLGVKVKEETNEDDALYRLDDYTTNEEEANDLFRVVDDASEIERLNSEPTVKVYRAMSLVDGKLYPPMSKKIGTGSNRISQAPSEFGQWEVSDERPELVEKEGTHKNHIYIVKDNGKGLWVAYNPYFHTSRNPLNDQFAEAYQRPNLVTVEVEVPESELTSGYQAEGAKDPVGETKWNAGPVNRQLSGDKKRKVILSRWMRPVRIVPDSEVAQRIAELIEGENVAIPDNTVTPSLLEELKKLGVKIVDGISKGRKKATAMMRGGNGALTDNELSYENDPVAKMTGRSTRTAAQRRAFAERERQRMVQRVQELAKKLHLDNVDIVTDASTLQGKRAKAKGFYSRGTGRITIVIPNHTSVYDVEQTLLHEAVAHYGLRQLFGEHFDTFLDNVFQNADKDVRRRITELARERNWDFRTATEEYLASLAENTNFENTDASWWQKIKELFLRMLHKIGFEDFSGVTLSDNELRYILWRSYENLAEPGRYRSILGEAEDVAKQNELKVGNYATDNDGTARNVAEQDELYRDGDPEVHERVLARDRYEQRVRRGMYQMQEALQDSMLGLREAMEAILKGEGKKKVRIEDVDGFENAYLGENRLSSVNKAEADAFAHTLFKPLLDEVGKLAPNKEAREELTDYMMAKHGLERNRVMREREKEKLIASSELAKLKPEQPSIDDDDYDLKMDAFDKAMEDWEKQVEEELGDKFEAIDKRDFAGLTALTEADNVADAETEAAAMVDAYESGHDTEALWKRTNDVSNAILSKLYETGMMSKDTYDNVRSMYEYYIPLRGFDEKTSDEAYAYLNSKNSAFNAPIKKAKGRKSKADDPLAYLQSMAESAITQGNRNKLVKQKFLNFVLNHPSDLASVSDLWLKYDKVADEWQPVFPDNINADDTPSEVERKMQDFEYKMKELAEQDPDLYKHGKDTVNIPYRVVEKRDLRQHQVVVKRGGRDYVITINGNPRAAQALNGQTNPDNDMSGAVGAILKAGERINRELSALYTTRNPDFVVSNFIRDMLYSNSMMWIKESPNYALRFHRNFAKVNPVRMKMLLAKYRKNELDMSNDTERMFHQFMMNGGETGYSNMRDIEKHKNDIRREIRKANGRLPIRKAWDFLAERLDEVNRGVENCARFAAFMTSREMGRTIDRSIYDAKEISVNFNKKGSGAKFMGATGQTKLGNASAFMSGLGRSGFVFWNAAIQGTANFGRQAKRHPAKALTSVAAMFLLGAIVASLGYGDDDEDDKNSYWNLPEYVRRSNLLFRAGGQWISIPLPVEYRAVYGLGELMVSTMSGKEHLTDGEIANAIAGQVSQLLPLDFLEGGGGMKAFIPSSIKPFAEASLNTSWTGLPIYKDTPYNKDMPEWTKAYKSANKYLVDLSETLNEISGGDEYKKGWVDKIVLPISRDIKFKLNNPAQWEYVLNGYFGGISNTIDRLTKMGETIIGQREYDPNSFLVLNRILKNGDERTEQKAVNNEYFKLQKEYENTKRLLRNYERDTDNGIFDYAEKIDFLYNSPEYARYEIFENYRPDIDGLYDMLKEANTYGDKEAVKDIEAQLNELKKMMINDMNKTRK